MADKEVHQIDNSQLSADLMRDMIKERKRERFWKNLRFFCGFALLLVILFLLLTSGNPNVNGIGEGTGYISLVRLDGMIAPGESFSAEETFPLLKDAFSDRQSKGVILDINSGGGTPVQASIIHDEVMRLKKKYKKTVVIVGEDMLTSGAYYVAVSGDKIYVNPNTITGSIGVIMQGFGLNDVIKKIGIERRVYTAGNNKDRLDPFLPQNPADIAKIHSVIDEVHNNFSQTVMEGRKGKLHGDPKELFSGDFWSGSTALKLGLVDALGNLSDAMQNEFHVMRYKEYKGTKSILKSLVGQIGSYLNVPLGNENLHLLEKI